MDLITWFNITVVVFTVANLMAGGLECDLEDALSWLRSPKLIVPSRGVFRDGPRSFSDRLPGLGLTEWAQESPGRTLGREKTRRRSRGALD